MSAAVQHAFLSIAPVANEGALRDVLQGMVQHDVEDNRWMPFGDLRSIHFARFAILPEDAGLSLQAKLIFASNFDGRLDDHLNELDHVAGASGLDEIYQHCEGYPAQPTSAERIRYLRTHSVPYGAWYGGTVGRTVSQIRDEAELCQAIGKILDGGEWNGSSAREVREAVQQRVLGNARFAWARTPPEPWLSRGTRLIKRYLLPLLIVAALAFVVLVIMGAISPIFVAAPVGVLAIFLVVLRIKEALDSVDLAAYSCPDVSNLMSQEDLTVQNQLMVLSYIKSGPFRRVTLRIVLAAINLFARFWANDGNLGGIPSIHFARWAVLDNGRRLLFLSNFDGSWENYLGDFIDKAAGGLTAVWSNTVGFPRTRFLIKEGARDEQRFKDFARKGQLGTQVWYTAYKELSVQNVNNNSRIRAGLYGAMSEPEAQEWLQRF